MITLLRKVLDSTPRSHYVITESRERLHTSQIHYGITESLRKIHPKAITLLQKVDFSYSRNRFEMCVNACRQSPQFGLVFTLAV